VLVAGRVHCGSKPAVIQDLRLYYYDEENHFGAPSLAEELGIRDDRAGQSWRYHQSNITIHNDRFMARGYLLLRTEVRIAVCVDCDEGYFVSDPIVTRGGLTFIDVDIQDGAMSTRTDDGYSGPPILALHLFPGWIVWGLLTYMGFMAFLRKKERSKVRRETVCLGLTAIQALLVFPGTYLAALVYFLNHGARDSWIAFLVCQPLAVGILTLALRLHGLKGWPAIRAATSVTVATVLTTTLISFWWGRLSNYAAP
jgi:hypothetical protein